MVSDGACGGGCNNGMRTRQKLYQHTATVSGLTDFAQRDMLFDLASGADGGMIRGILEMAVVFRPLGGSSIISMSSMDGGVPWLLIIQLAPLTRGLVRK